MRNCSFSWARTARSMIHPSERFWKRPAIVSMTDSTNVSCPTSSCSSRRDPSRREQRREVLRDQSLLTAELLRSEDASRAPGAARGGGGDPGGEIVQLRRSAAHLDGGHPPEARRGGHGSREESAGVHGCGQARSRRSRNRDDGTPAQGGGRSEGGA